MERNRCILLNMAATLYHLITEPRPDRSVRVIQALWLLLSGY